MDIEIIMTDRVGIISNIIELFSNVVGIISNMVEIISNVVGIISNIVELFSNVVGIMSNTVEVFSIMVGIISHFQTSKKQSPNPSHSLHHNIHELFWIPRAYVLR